MLEPVINITPESDTILQDATHTSITEDRRQDVTDNCTIVFVSNGSNTIPAAHVDSQDVMPVSKSVLTFQNITPSNNDDL